jgi:2-keto-4-pentenoate hydratase
MAIRDEAAMTERVIACAQALMSEHASGVQYRPFAAAHGITTVDDAYAVQREYVRLQTLARNTGTAGYKIGLTTPRMQAMCGIDRPIAGVVLADRVHASGATLRADAYGRMALEFEIAVRLAHDLVSDGRRPTIDEVAAAVDGVAAAVEIIDDRGADYRALDALSLIADNAWNGGIVLGAFTKPWPDLAATEGIVSLDGAVLDRGLGRDVLGHPFHAVAWLATHLADQGSRLCAGEVVMTGSVVTTKFPDRAFTYRFALWGVGVVEVSVSV